MKDVHSKFYFEARILFCGLILAGLAVVFGSVSVLAEHKNAAGPERTADTNVSADVNVSADADSRPILIINEDNDHYFKQTADLMTLEALQAYIDQMRGTYVTHFFMCPQGQRTSYRSAVHEAVWEGMADGSPVDLGPGEAGIRWTSNCRKLHEMGIDPYAVWTARCREAGISPWISMRMNDVHFVLRKNYFRNFNYWREHPELWRVPHSRSNTWTDYAFNYAKQEVRDFHMACAKELLDRYDMDGFEMDWMRFCLHLTPGKETEEAHCLTEFVREVRNHADRKAKERGHRILISVRVPATPQASDALGMRAAEWAKEGLIDQIVASCFFSTGDFNIVAEDWKKAVGDPDFPVFTAVDDGVSCGSGTVRTRMTPEMYAGWANAMLGNGTDGLYLFNLVYRPDVFQQIIARGFEPEKILNVHRRHVVTYRDFMATYGKKELDEERQLPRFLHEPHDVRIQFGKRPETDGKLWVSAGFFAGEGLKEAEFQVRLNGAEALSAEELSDPKAFGGMARAVRFQVPLSAAKDGLNTVSIAMRSGKVQRVGWLEMEFVPAEKSE